MLSFNCSQGSPNRSFSLLIHGSGRAVKLRKAWNTYHINNIRWTPGGYREGCGERKMQAQIFNMLQTWQSDLSLTQSQWERKVRIKTRKKEEKKTVTQGRNQTHNLANGLPCSNQLSYRVTRQLSGWIQVLKAELPGIHLKQTPSCHVWWGGCGEREVRGIGLDSHWL